MASVAQWLEHWIVDPGVVGSIPIIRPKKLSTLYAVRGTMKNDLSTTYLKRASEFCQADNIKLRSTVLFGGQVKGYTSAASDVDVIFIVDNATSQDKVNSLINYLQSLEVALGIRKASTSGFSIVLDRIGAQYKSVFVCKEEDFIKGNVSNIFRSDSFLDSVILDNPIWATDIGLKNILLTAKVVQGSDLLPHLKKKLAPIEAHHIKRNRRMYTALALFGIITYPFSNNATKYSMSSLKWALHSSYFGGFGKLGSLDDEINHFKKAVAHTRTHNALDELVQLRSEYKKTLRFNINALIAARKIFNHAIKDGKYPVQINLSLQQDNK